MDMSSKRIKGNANLRRGLGSKTTDSDKIMEDPPAGDWLALRSDQLLKWIDDAVYNAAETTGMREVVDRVTRPIFNYAQRFSPHPLHFGIMCCAIEMGQASAPDHDIDRLGLVYRSSPRQCDVLIVNGPVCEKLRPKLKTLYEQMPEPKWVIAMVNVQFQADLIGIPIPWLQVQTHSCQLMFTYQDVLSDQKH